MKKVYKYKIEALKNGYLLRVRATNQVSEQFCFPDLDGVREHISEDLRLLVEGEEDTAENEHQEEGECCDCSGTQ